MQLALSSAFDNEVAYQVAEALVLIVGVVLGWLVWPAIRQKMAQRALQQKEEALLQESTTCDMGMMEEVEGGEAEDEEQDLSRAEHLKVVALLDHYDLFGASLGAWSSIRSHDTDLAEHSLAAPTRNMALAGDSETSTSGTIEVAHNVRTSSTDKLFEHYGLFGASAGAWSS